MNNHKKPMHKHRTRSNGVSIKMRLAASKNVRTRHKDGMKITLPKEPWNNQSLNGSKQNSN